MNSLSFNTILNIQTCFININCANKEYPDQSKQIMKLIEYFNNIQTYELNELKWKSYFIKKLINMDTDVNTSIEEINTLGKFIIENNKLFKPFINNIFELANYKSFAYQLDEFYNITNTKFKLFDSMKKLESINKKTISNLIIKLMLETTNFIFCGDTVLNVITEKDILDLDCVIVNNINNNMFISMLREIFGENMKYNNNNDCMTLNFLDIIKINFNIMDYNRYKNSRDKWEIFEETKIVLTHQGFDFSDNVRIIDNEFWAKIHDKKNLNYYFKNIREHKLTLIKEHYVNMKTSIKILKYIYKCKANGFKISDGYFLEKNIYDFSKIIYLSLIQQFKLPHDLENVIGKYLKLYNDMDVCISCNSQLCGADNKIIIKTECCKVNYHLWCYQNELENSSNDVCCSCGNSNIGY